MDNIFTLNFRHWRYFCSIGEQKVIFHFLFSLIYSALLWKIHVFFVLVGLFSFCLGFLVITELCYLSWAESDKSKPRKVAVTLSGDIHKYNAAFLNEWWKLFLNAQIITSFSFFFFFLLRIFFNTRMKCTAFLCVWFHYKNNISIGFYFITFTRPFTPNYLLKSTAQKKK